MIPPNSNVASLRVLTPTGMLGVVCLCLIAGCRSTPVTTPPAATPIATPSAPPVSDTSLPVDGYVRIGMPDPSRLWTAGDYRDCRNVLYTLDRTNRAALPRMESSKSGAVFARMINPTNTLPLADRFLPTQERIGVFYTILNRLPAFRDIYRFRPGEPVFHSESIELDHTFLRMLGSAVEWDGKRLAPAAGETQPAVFQLNESSRTRIEGLLDVSAEQSVVPRGDRFLIIGTYSAVVFRSRLPWVADGTGLSDAQRLRVLRYLREDMPVLWPHVSPTQQRESMSDLDEVLRRTSPQEIRQELESLRQQLAPR